MRIIGYSERGLVNSLLYEIAFSEAPTRLLGRLMSLAVFPYTEQHPPGGEATVLVEQSFSQFGTSDAVVIYNSEPCLIFVEAKVKTGAAREWSISDEYARFVSGLRGSVSSSNLFAQLYYKYCLVREIRSGGKQLASGVEFPEWSSPRGDKKSIRKIGNNGTVLRAVDLLTGGAGKAFYLAIIPERVDRAASFFDTELTGGRVEALSEWDLSTCGFLTWGQIAEFCAQQDGQDMRNTLAVLDFNSGQVY